MKTKRFDFNFKPLQIDLSFMVDGSVPDKQNYNGDNNTYTPDYSLTPCIIQPVISRMDKDEVLQAGQLNHELANVRWYEIQGGTTTLIEDSNAGYEITRSGAQAGRIKVKRNAAPNNPITLQFYAEYADTRTGQLHIIQGTHKVFCGNATAYIPQLVLNAADQTIYNPINDPDTQVVTASLRLGTNECPAAKRIFVWEIYREDNTWTAVGEDLDYHVTVAVDGGSVTVNRALMGKDLYLRCRAKYDPDGNPAGVTLTDAAPAKIVAFVRRIPKYEFDIVGAPVNIPAGIVAIAPEAYIWDVNGPIDNPERELLPIWYMATNQASGSLSYSQVAHGSKPTIPTKAMSTIHGGVLGLDVIDAGPNCAWEDGDGHIYEDGDGNIILIK